ncbi:MAG TPA: hypothetical protein VM183_09355 [Burkholderiales bacterium]|nr:hypothetical protein [Burkholderiales bacterium]
MQAALLVFAAPAYSARPFFTDDARVVEKGHCQIETFYKDQRTYAGSEFWFLPACNPSFVPMANGLELTVAANRIEGDRNTIVQAKYLFKELQTNGIGFAGSAGTFGGETFVNGIASFSFLDDRAVVHANLGRFRETGATWGLGLEALLSAPRVYGILETFGQRGEAATYHYGIRFWVIPNRFQIDATRGDQGGGDPDRRFYSLGLRFIF